LHKQTFTSKSSNPASTSACASHRLLSSDVINIFSLKNSNTVCYGYSYIATAETLVVKQHRSLSVSASDVYLKTQHNVERQEQ